MTLTMPYDLDSVLWPWRCYMTLTMPYEWQCHMTLKMSKTLKIPYDLDGAFWLWQCHRTLIMLYDLDNFQWPWQWTIPCTYKQNIKYQNLRFPMLGKSGSLMSLIFCGMFISLTADTARAGAADIPAWERERRIRIKTADVSAWGERWQEI